MYNVENKSLRLSQDGLDRIERYLQGLVDEGTIPGAVSLIAHNGHIEQLLPVGSMDLASQRPMQADTVFRIYSLSKIVTSVAVMILYDEGHFWLEEPIADFIPALRDLQVFVSKGPDGIEVEPPKRDVSIFDLLTHTGGIGMDALYGSPLGSVYREADLGSPDQTLEQLMDKLAELPLLHHPGDKWQYSIGTDILARLVEVVSGQSFDAFLRERIFDPLEMHDTDFWVPAEKVERLATVYRTKSDGQLEPVDEAASSPYTKQPALLSGSAGLVSTPIDFYKFAQMLLDRGDSPNGRILRPEMIDLMTRNHLSSDLLPYALPWNHVKHYTQGAGFGLGVRVVTDVEACDEPASLGEYGWAGATNTFLWVDPVKDLVLLLFMQTIPFMHYPIHTEFKTVVYEALE